MINYLRNLLRVINNLFSLETKDLVHPKLALNRLISLH
jgi:hypothetical protein